MFWHFAFSHIAKGRTSSLPKKESPGAALSTQLSRCRFPISMMGLAFYADHMASQPWIDPVSRVNMQLHADAATKREIAKALKIIAENGKVVLYLLPEDLLSAVGEIVASVPLDQAAVCLLCTAFHAVEQPVEPALEEFLRWQRTQSVCAATTDRSVVLRDVLGYAPSSSMHPPSPGPEIMTHKIAQAIRNRGLLCPLDVLLVGATGTGKSSTINAVFGTTVAKVGDGVDPETMRISDFPIDDYLRIHDSAGLGDGAFADESHSAAIEDVLTKRCGAPHSQYAFMDLVLVVLDGGSRDLGTAFRLLESVVLKSIEPERVIVAINQADMAMKGRNWDSVSSRPNAELTEFLRDQAASVQRRLQESTNLRISRPVHYSAKYGWNIDALMDHIVAHLPRTRRPAAKVALVF